MDLVSQWRNVSSIHQTQSEDTRNIVPTSGRHYRWCCSLVHTRTVFVCAQLAMFVYALCSLACVTNVVPACRFVDSRQRVHYLMAAVVLIFCVLLGFAGMHIALRVHRLGRRLWRVCTFPPVLLLFPSLMAQAGCILSLGYWTYVGVLHKFESAPLSSMTWPELLEEVVLLTALPIAVHAACIVYAMFASFDYMFYVSRKSRHWRCTIPAPAALTLRSYAPNTFDGRFVSSGTGRRSKKNTDVLDCRRSYTDSPSPSEAQLALDRSLEHSVSSRHRLGSDHSERASLQHSAHSAGGSEGDGIFRGIHVTSAEGSTSSTERVRTEAALPRSTTRALAACVSPVRRHLETVIEESKSLTSSEAGSTVFS